LGKIASAGQNGQFRTPRHIIGLMVELTAPSPGDVICDPASGTCGFLVAANEYLRKHYPEILRDAKLKEHFHQTVIHKKALFTATFLLRSLLHRTVCVAVSLLPLAVVYYHTNANVTA